MSVFNWLQGGIDARIKQRAQEWAYELESSYFEVVLIPACPALHSGHSLRALQSGNPKWYSQLCAAHTSIRGKGRKKNETPPNIYKEM